METTDDLSSKILDVKAWCRKNDCIDAIDCVIQDLHSQVASELNNRGFDDQVKYLFGLGYTVKDAKECIREAINA